MRKLRPWRPKLPQLLGGETQDHLCQRIPSLGAACCHQPIRLPWTSHRTRDLWFLICQPRPRDNMILELPSRNNIPGCSVPLPAQDSQSSLVPQPAGTLSPMEQKWVRWRTLKFLGLWVHGSFPLTWVRTERDSFPPPPSPPLIPP